MLQPTVVLDAILESLRSIPQLVAELGGPAVPATQTIYGHYYYSGEENALAKDLATMRQPSILLGYLAYLGGNFDGQTVWKHQIGCYVRSRNKATDVVTNHSSLSAADLWWMAMNYPISVPEPANNIRYIELCDGNLQLMDLPTGMPRTDEMGQDLWSSMMVFAEKGDVGPPGVDLLCPD